MKGEYVLIFVIILLIAAAILFIGPPGQQRLPGYVLANPLIEEAYTFAMENPSALEGVNCYCGCMQHLHEGRIHKRGLLDCFMKENGDFEMHASECDMCINDALEVKRMTAEGKNKTEIKAAIDQKYV